MSDSAPKLQAFGQIRPQTIYIRRKGVDQEVEQALRDGHSCVILGGYQVGKSSLRVKLAELLRKQHGVLVASIDLQGFVDLEATPPAPGESHTSGPNAADGRDSPQWDWYRRLFIKLLAELSDPATDSPETQVKAFLDQHPGRSPSETLCALLIHLSQHPRAKSGLVLLFDEVQTALHRHGFFAGLRAAHEAIRQPAGPPFSLALFGVFATSQQLLSQSLKPVLDMPDLQRYRLPPFERTDLDGFLPALKGLEREGVQLSAILDAVYSWTHGQPHLTHRTLTELRRQGVKPGPESMSVDAVVTELYLQPGRVDSDFLAQLRHDIPNHLKPNDKEPNTRIRTLAMLYLYRRLLQNPDSVSTQPDAPLQELLLNQGMCRVEGSHLRISNRVVEAVAGPDWLKSLEFPDYLSRFHAWRQSGRTAKHRDVSLLLGGQELDDGIALLAFEEALDREELRDFKEYIEIAKEEQAELSLFDKYQKAIVVAFFVLIAVLSASLSINIWLNSSYNALRQQYNRLSEEEKLLEEKIKKLGDEISSKNRTAEQMNLLLSTAKKRTDDLELELYLNKKEIENQKQLIDIIKIKTKQYDELSGKLRKSEEKRRRLQSELSEIRNQLETLREDVSAMPKLVAGGSEVTALSTGKSSKWAYYGTAVGGVAVLDLITKEVKYYYRPHMTSDKANDKANVLTIAPSPDEQRLVSGDRGGKLCVTDLTRLEPPFHTCKLAHVKGTLSVGYFSKDPKNPKEQLIISSGEDGTVKLWTLTRTQPDTIGELVERSSISIKQPVAAIAASANGKQLIIGSNDRSARIYQIDDPAKPSLRHTLSGHASWISYVWLNSRGTRALVATPGGAVSSWFLDRTPPVRTDNTDLLQKFQKHIKADERKITSGVVTDIVSTENGFYSISIDTKVESAWVWETFSGAPVADLTREPENKYVDQINTKMTKGSKPNNRKPDNKIKVNEKKSDNGVRVRCARFTSDGKYAITGGQDGKVRVYQLSALRGTE